MKKNYWIKCVKYVKFKESKMLHIWSKTVVSAFCEKCSSNNDKIFKEQEPVKILKILGLIGNIEK